MRQNMSFVHIDVGTVFTNKTSMSCLAITKTLNTKSYMPVLGMNIWPCNKMYCIFKTHTVLPCYEKTVLIKAYTVLL